MDYIGRSVWGAQYAAGFGARSLPCSEAWLHHTVTKQLGVDASAAEEHEQMRAIERIGQQRFGGGFSYNLAVMPSGRVYVGCGVRRVGSHTAKRNTRALGIALVGDYSKTEPSPQMLDALVEVLRDAKRLGWLPEAKLNGGHRDVSSTGCPGEYAYRLIGTVNTRAAGAEPSPTPTPTPTPVTPTKGTSSMIIVLHPDGHRQYVCTVDSARHIGMPERNVLVAGGVPYVGADAASAADRGEFLRLRGVEL